MAYREVSFVASCADILGSSRVPQERVTRLEVPCLLPGSFPGIFLYRVDQNINFGPIWLTRLQAELKVIREITIVINELHIANSISFLDSYSKALYSERVKCFLLCSFDLPFYRKSSKTIQF